MNKSVRARRDLRRQLLIATGRYRSPFTDVTPARNHVVRLHALGMSDDAISKASGVGEATIGFWRRGRAGTVVQRGRRDLVARVLAVRFSLDTLDDGALISSLGTARRIRALQRLGYSLKHLEAETATDFRDISRLTRQELVTVSKARAVRDAYARLCMTPGPSGKASRWAAARDYPAPLAWDDIDTDPKPRGVPKSRTDVIDVGEVVHLLRGGVSIRQAAQRLGFTVSGVEKVLQREAPELLAQVRGAA